MLEFEWDDLKNKSNRQKHGIWFEEASDVFVDPLARVFDSLNHTDPEHRFLILGMDANRRILIVVYAYRNTEDFIRIISARRATKKERELYEERI